MIGRDDIRTISRGYAVFGVLGFFLVLFNFGLDVLRRFDFEGERTEIDDHLTRLRTQIDDSFLMLAELQSSERALGDSYDAIQRCSESLLALTADVLAYRAEQPDRIAIRHAVSELPGDEISDLRPSAFLEDVRRAPLAEVLASFEERLSQPFIQVFVKEHLAGSPREWDPEVVLEALEREFVDELDPSERDALRIRIEAYRTATEAAFLHYETGLRATMAERILDGDYERLDRTTGRFIGIEQESEDRESLAVSIKGRTHFAWAKEDYPELHRLDTLHKLIPLLMAEELHGYFTERSPR